MIWLVWLTPRNNLGMRKVRPFVVRVKGVPLYLVLYSLNGKESHRSGANETPNGADRKAQIPAGFPAYGFANYLIFEAGSTAWLQGSGIEEDWENLQSRE